MSCLHSLAYGCSLGQGFKGAVCFHLANAWWFRCQEKWPGCGPNPPLTLALQASGPLCLPSSFSPLRHGRLLKYFPLIVLVARLFILFSIVCSCFLLLCIVSTYLHYIMALPVSSLWGVGISADHTLTPFLKYRIGFITNSSSSSLNNVIRFQNNSCTSIQTSSI